MNWLKLRKVKLLFQVSIKVQLAISRVEGLVAN